MLYSFKPMKEKSTQELKVTASCGWWERGTGGFVEWFPEGDRKAHGVSMEDGVSLC